MKPNTKRFSYAPNTSFAIAGDDENRTVGDRIGNLTQEQQDRLDALKLQAKFDAEDRGEILNQEEIDRLAAVELDKIRTYASTILNRGFLSCSMR